MGMSAESVRMSRRRGEPTKVSDIVAVGLKMLSAFPLAIE
jgi:hypothetical protein